MIIYVNRVTCNDRIRRSIEYM